MSSISIYYFKHQLLIVLFLLTLLILNAITSKTKSYCHLNWPEDDGIWINESPFWISPNCKSNQAFSQQNITNCMQNRTIYVMGNSVIRQAAFSMVSLLGGENVLRENQKKLCPKFSLGWEDESCHNILQGVKIRYLFFRWMDGLNYTNRGGFPYFRQKSVDTSTGKINIITGKLPNITNSYGNTPHDFDYDKKLEGRYF